MAKEKTYEFSVKVTLNGSASICHKRACNLAYRILTEILYNGDPEMKKIVDDNLSPTHGPGHLIVPTLYDLDSPFDAGVEFNIK